MTHDDDELARILAEIREREGPPVEYDPRAGMVAVALLVASTIVVFALGWSVWPCEWKVF